MATLLLREEWIYTLQAIALQANVPCVIRVAFSAGVTLVAAESVELLLKSPSLSGTKASKT